MKPMFCLHLLLFLLFFPTGTQAHLYSHHIKPTVEDGFDSTGFIIIGSGILATALAQTQDYAVRDAYQDHQRISTSQSKVGDFLGTGIPGATIALAQIFLDREAGVAHAEALIDTFIVTSILKTANRRNRPDSENKQSMPSGHSSTTFASATSLAYAYGWAGAVPAYLLAGFTAATRWSDDAHWFSDTVAGAFVGFFWGRATAGHHGLRCFTPFVSTTHAGAFYKFSF